MKFHLVFKNLLNNLFQHFYSKTTYDTLKDPTFLTSPVNPPQISPEDSISTQRDDYLIPILSNDTSLPNLNSHHCIYPTVYTFKIHDISQGLTKIIKFSHFSLISSDPPFMIWKLMKVILIFFHLLSKQHITMHTLHFSNIKSQNVVSS